MRTHKNMIAYQYFTFHHVLVRGGRNRLRHNLDARTAAHHCAFLVPCHFRLWFGVHLHRHDYFIAHLFDGGFIEKFRRLSVPENKDELSWRKTNAL